MRRTGHDPLDVARDLIAATYDSDALDTLRTTDDPGPGRSRRSPRRVARYPEAEAAYRQWLAQTPGDAQRAVWPGWGPGQPESPG